jgi:hypothetical protein
MAKDIKIVSGLEPKIGRGNPPKRTQFPKGTSGKGLDSAEAAAVWAHRVLGAKNTLTAVDANCVEQARSRRGWRRSQLKKWTNNGLGTAPNWMAPIGAKSGSDDQLLSTKAC